MTALRIFVVDDHDVVRDGLRLYVEDVPDLTIVGEAATVEDAVREIDRLAPDVAIVDVMLPDGEGVEVIRTLLGRKLPTRFVVFTTFESEEILVQARMAGAAGYLFKDAPRTQLLETIRAAAAGRSTICPTMLDEVRARRSSTTLEELLPDFTAQERRIVELIAEGATNREIGERLTVTEKTARNYVSAILARLGFRNRTEVAVYVTRRLAASVRRPPVTQRPASVRSRPLMSRVS